MKKLLIPLAALLFVSCNSKEKLLSGTWQAIRLDNATLDEMVAEQRRFIDTVGRHTGTEENLELYGSDNIDSLRRSLQTEIDSFLYLQQRNLAHTRFTFLENGTVILNFNGMPDSASWYFNDEGLLILDEIRLKGTGDRTRMEVRRLEKDTLELQFTENGITGAATFVQVHE